MNNDIRLLMRELKAKMDSGSTPPDDPGDDDLSATSLLLGRLGSNRTIN